MRNYGLGYSGEVIGKPSAEPVQDEAFQRAVKDSDGCPSCHCAMVQMPIPSPEKTDG